MEQLKKILDTFGSEYHNCKSEGKHLPKLVIVCDELDPERNCKETRKRFLSLPAVAFNVSFITGREYCERNFPGIEDETFNDENGRLYLQEAGGAAYNANDRSVYVLYPYPGNNGFPLERSIIHEMGHYKQDVLHDARRTGNDGDNIILEYHNIMVNENRSRTTISGCGTCHGQRVSYNIGQNHSMRFNATQLIAAKPILVKHLLEVIIPKYPTRTQLLTQMVTALNVADNINLEINIRLIINMLVDLKCPAPGI